MGQFCFEETFLNGLYVITPKIFSDNRGYFMEAFNQDDFRKNGLDVKFVQDNQSYSIKGVLRGIHFQKQNPQGKLVRVIKGEVFDVAVDLRKGSRTYGKWYRIVLSEYNKKQLYIPEGFGHAFLVLSDTAEVTYKCTQFYNCDDEGGIIWNDPHINIKWPLDRITTLILSDKDKKWGTLKDNDLIFNY